MVKQHQKNADTGTKPLKQEKSKELEDKENKEINCRCKEAKGKTLPQMLKQMIDDLSFWKKDRR